LEELLTLIEEYFARHSLLGFGALLVGGYLLGELARIARLPEITGYILAGVLLGPSLLGVVSHDMVPALTVVSEVALGLIALTIGGEFYWNKMKRTGRQVVTISVLEILATFSLVTIAMLLFGVPLPFALLLGAVSSATAPAATVAVVKSLGARGRYVDVLYGLVALDDAGAIIAFGIAFAVAGQMVGMGGAGAAPTAMIGTALLEVVLSVVVGAVAGYIMWAASRRQLGAKGVVIISLGLTFLTIGTASAFHLSPLLANMAAGATIVNLTRGDTRLFAAFEPLTVPMYALFFVIAGTELQPSVLTNPQALTLGIAFVLARALGKYGGVFAGAALSRSDQRIRNNLGLSMLPQAGVAIGLVLLVRSSPLAQSVSDAGAAYLDLLVNVTLFSVLVNELIGPPLAKMGVVNGTEVDRR
jgi:Kef-type K+ transport system membrane component KefB